MKCFYKSNAIENPYSIIIYLFVSVVPQPVYMNTNDLAELAAQKKNDQQISQYQNSENQRYHPNEPCDDSQDLKTPTAENQQSLMENKVLITILLLTKQHNF